MKKRRNQLTSRPNGEPTLSKDAKRILVIGSGGSGKTTLAIELGKMLSVPVIHLDKLFWLPGWMQTPAEEWEQKLTHAISGENWIIDGNYFKSLSVRLSRADTVIYLDYNRWLCVLRAFKRWRINKGKVRPDMGDGCPEKMDLGFLKWILRFPKKTKPQMLEALKDFSGSVILCKSPKHTKRFLEQLFLHNA